MPIPFPRPLVLGHRGSPLRAPENSLRSFALAIEQGADGVELDVQRSADGVPVVIHDATLDRTGHGEGPVAARSWASLSRLSGGGEPLPSLEQAAAWAARSDAWLNVELKAHGVEEAVLEALSRAGVRERAFLSSFDAGTMRRLAALAPDTLRFLLADAWDGGVREAAASAAVHGVCLRADAAAPAALESLLGAGYAAVVWTVDDADAARAVLRAGVAAVITNRPSIAAAAREAAAGP